MRVLRLAALAASCATTLLDATSADPCDLTGEWSPGWPAKYSGGPVTSFGLGSPIVVRRASTPYGRTGTQYMAGGGDAHVLGNAYGQALAEFPDLSVCLGNGTCKPCEFARTRPLNASTLPCTFIEWPAGSPHTGGWCRSSVCPVPPAPPTLNLSWTPTYSMRLSTMSNPNGNNTGLDSEWLLDRDAQYGIIIFDGSFEECITERNDAPADDRCKYTRSQMEDVELQARKIKAISPGTRVFSYHNMDLFLSRNEQDCPLMYDPAYEGYFCRDVSGDILNDPAVLSPAFAASCAAVAPTTAFDRMDIYIKDWRNASLRTWWLDEVIGRVISSEVIDGFYWDDPTFGSEHPTIMSNFTAAEIADINSHIKPPGRKPRAGWLREASGRWGCSRPCQRRSVAFLSPAAPAILVHPIARPATAGAPPASTAAVIVPRPPAPSSCSRRRGLPSAPPFWRFRSSRRPKTIR
eukprot:m.36973 g.36973  ORF g.36973 m.36973 type:complete len:464 (+) comp7631_c0_seq1:146-1537(+)